MSGAASLLLAAIPGEFLAAPVDRIIGAHADLGPIVRNLHLREKELVLNLPEPGLIENIGEEKALEKYTRGLDLIRRDLRYADLAYADLRRADLRWAELQGANLWGADLRGVNLFSADLEGAVLSSANLNGAQLNHADLKRAELKEAELQATDFSNANLQGASLSRANAQGSNLFSAKLQGANLASANLQGANLNVAQLQGSSLVHAILYAVNFHAANLQGAQLHSAKLQGAHLEKANLRGADLREANLWRAFIGNDVERDARWELTDLQAVRVDALDNIDQLITSVAEKIEIEWARKHVVQQLENALRLDDRFAIPYWHSQPKAMFHSDDEIPRKQGWSPSEWRTTNEYDEELAKFLGDLACSKETSAEVAVMLAERISFHWNTEHDRELFVRRIADRLTTDPSGACGPGLKLPGDIRNQLELLATANSE